MESIEQKVTVIEINSVETLKSRFDIARNENFELKVKKISRMKHGKQKNETLKRWRRKIKKFSTWM